MQPPLSQPDPLDGQTLPKPLWKRIVLIATEVLLLPAILGLITAILLPVRQSVSPERAIRCRGKTLNKRIPRRLEAAH